MNITTSFPGKSTGIIDLYIPETAVIIFYAIDYMHNRLLLDNQETINVSLAHQIPNPITITRNILKSLSILIFYLYIDNQILNITNNSNIITSSNNSISFLEKNQTIFTSMPTNNFKNKSESFTTTTPLILESSTPSKSTNVPFNESHYNFVNFDKNQAQKNVLPSIFG